MKRSRRKASNEKTTNSPMNYLLQSMRDPVFPHFLALSPTSVETAENLLDGTDFFFSSEHVYSKWYELKAISSRGDTTG